MKFLDLKMPDNNNVELTAGKLLIAEPFLADPSFARSVILLCEHNDGGSIGFVMNRPTEATLGELIPELYGSHVEINQGGPVELNTLHMLHRIPDILGGNKITEGVYWGGSYEVLQNALADQLAYEHDLRLFVGYSGWAAGQLDKELEEGSWIVADINPEILFNTAPRLMWQAAIKSLGNEYAHIANMPLNPQLN